ncbi:MAG TPA: RNA polymerase sigma factor [Candidatus Binatia bacterium]|jgi:RNA polymerase sigma-70 factor (ECF subfamily)|nr:RNA polymerase sigma factor [Candidatus Binatia bacterium]
MVTDEPDAGASPDDVVVARVLGGDIEAFEILMRRYNQRVFRAARAVLRDELEAEDVVQDAWVRAYTHLRQFAGRASFATWLTRIAVHEAIARGRRRARHVALEAAGSMVAPTPSPDDELGSREMVAAIEAATDALPARYRTVFMLRDLEGLSVAETAGCLDVPEATVKTRLHRARGLLRTRLDATLDVSTHGVFAFAGHRCDRIVTAVMARIRSAP